MNINYSIPQSCDWLIQFKSQLELNWSNDSISKHFQNENSFNLIIQQDQIPIGLLIGHFIFQDIKLIEFEILHIALLPNYRNQGHGYKLLIELEKHLKIKEKTIKIFLETGSANKFAIKLYEKLGYKAYNERKNYYGSNPINPSSLQDAILFAKNLNART